MGIQRKHYYIIFIVGAILLSNIPVLHWPFSWLETYFHEISHGLAALISGGDVAKIVLRFNGSGVCYTRGGWGPLVAFSGYAGASIWGGLIYAGARMTGRASKWLSLLVAVFMAITAILWAKDLVTWVVLSVMCVTLYISFHYIIGSIFPFFMEFAGIYVMVSAIRAPVYLLYDANAGDGANLADMTYIPEVLWVAIWCVFACSVLYFIWRRQLTV